MKPSINFGAVIKLIEDAATDFPKIEAAFATVQAVAGEVTKGQMPTPAQIAALEADLPVVMQLFADVKAVVG